MFQYFITGLGWLTFITLVLFGIYAATVIFIKLIESRIIKNIKFLQQMATDSLKKLRRNVDEELLSRGE